MFPSIAVGFPKRLLVTFEFSVFLRQLCNAMVEGSDLGSAAI
jgi:hypothetical protein